jgi:hypothetical protein
MSANLNTYVKIVVYHNNELLGSDSVTINNKIYDFESENTNFKYYPKLRLDLDRKWSVWHRRFTHLAGMDRTM